MIWKSSDLAYEASLKALADAGAKPEELDMIIVATETPDYKYPSTACLLQAKLGAKNAACFDLSAGCSGFVYALGIGSQSMRPFPGSWTGRTATPACCSATGRERP